MKTKPSLRAFLSICGSLIAASPLHAVDLYWDGNDSAAGFGTAGGTWANPTAGTLTSGWSTDVLGASVIDGNSVATSLLDTMNFGTGSGLAAGTITVSGTVDAGNITIGSASGAIILSGGIINLASGATITTNNPVATLNSITSVLAGSGGSPRQARAI